MPKSSKCFSNKSDRNTEKLQTKFSQVHRKLMRVKNQWKHVMVQGELMIYHCRWLGFRHFPNSKEC